MWQGTLSIQSCFPEGNSTPNSARSQPSSARSQPSTMVTIEMPPKNLASTVVPPQPSSRSVVSLQRPDRTNTVIAAFSNMVPSEVTSGPASASLLTSPRGLLRVSCIHLHYLLGSQRGRKQFFTLQLEPDRPSLWKS
ncbi:uncharacterized protein LOC114284957 [Camellia sinensis]|uniref:uncharacterized protein LOC114284957 n=1 Tax=Camellia sinensis TaxID=4442 RepID=UPI001035B7A0|nr:uncharacterized protein LOC114284957 [Camellia sinensis]